MSLLSLFKNTNPKNPNTLIWGSDEFLNSYLAKSYLKLKQFADFEQVEIDCEHDGLDELVVALNESSLFAPQKLILVRQPYFLTGKPTKKDHRQLQQLERILTKQNDQSNVVVFLASYPKLDRRRKLTKLLLANLNVVTVQVKSYQTEMIIKKIAAAENYQFNNGALNLLITRSDSVLDTALANYQKLKEITTDHQLSQELVAKNIDLSLAQNVFAILQAALAHDYHQAIMRLHEQIRQGSNPAQLLAIFSGQVELLVVVKVLNKRGRSQEEISRQLGIHPYRIKLALQNREPLNRLKQLLCQIIKFDYQFKQGQINQDNFLDLLLLAC